jgi:hypothetical protein
MIPGGSRPVSPVNNIYPSNDSYEINTNFTDI